MSDFLCMTSSWQHGDGKPESIIDEYFLLLYNISLNCQLSVIAIYNKGKKLFI